MAAETGEKAACWRHAALVVRQFRSVPRALRQLRQHAAFTSSPDKAAVYREAFAIVCHHTGETLVDPPAGAPGELQLSFA